MQFGGQAGTIAASGTVVPDAAASIPDDLAAAPHPHRRRGRDAQPGIPGAVVLVTHTRGAVAGRVSARG